MSEGAKRERRFYLDDVIAFAKTAISCFEGWDQYGKRVEVKRMAA